MRPITAFATLTLFTVIHAQLLCNQSTSMLKWYIQKYVECQKPTNDTICLSMNYDAYYVAGSKDSLMIMEPYLALYNLTSKVNSGFGESMSLLLGGQIGAIEVSAGTLGEMAFVLDEIASGWATLFSTNATVLNTDFWRVWTNAWSNMAISISLSDITEEPWYSRNLLRMTNYYFLAHHPIPVADFAQAALLNSYRCMYTYLNTQKSTITYQNVSIPYVTDDGTSVQLPGLFVAPKNVNSPPLVIATCGGLDWPLPGEVIRSMFSYLEAGYAVLYYEGPGMGLTPLDPTSLRFTPYWDRVLTAVATYAPLHLSNYYDTSINVTAVSESFGGFLNAQACAKIDKKLIQGCIIDPATPNIAWSLNYQFVGEILSAFENVDPALITASCGSSCVQYATPYWNVNATYTPQPFTDNGLMRSLTNTSCTSGRTLLSELFSGLGFPYSSDIVYFVYSIVPPGPTTYQDLNHLTSIVDSYPQNFSALVVESYRLLQEFRISKEQVANTSVPIAAFSTTEDYGLQSALTTAYFNTLPASSQGLFKQFNVSSGAALHCETTAWDVVAPYYFRFLNHQSVKQSRVCKSGPKKQTSSSLKP